jgi:hypothetical protein
MSGGMLLARQTFRRLFRSERVDEKEGLVSALLAGHRVVAFGTAARCREKC